MPIWNDQGPSLFSSSRLEVLYSCIDVWRAAKHKFEQNGHSKVKARGVHQLTRANEVQQCSSQDGCCAGVMSGMVTGQAGC